MSRLRALGAVLRGGLRVGRAALGAGLRNPLLMVEQALRAGLWRSPIRGWGSGVGLQQGLLYGPGLAGVLGAPRLLFLLLPLGALLSGGRGPPGRCTGRGRCSSAGAVPAAEGGGGTPERTRPSPTLPQDPESSPFLMPCRPRQNLSTQNLPWDPKSPQTYPSLPSLG